MSRPAHIRPIFGEYYCDPSLVDTAQARRLATVLKSLLEVIYLENGISPGPLGT